MIYIIRITIIVSLLLLTACKKSKKPTFYRLQEDSKTVKVLLIDSLGTIDLTIPSRYDTNFAWIHYSDCGKPCNEQKYRFQPKTLPAIKESGWYWSEPKDSAERLTISHRMYFPFQGGDTANSFGRHSHIKERLISGPQNPPIIFDTIQKINDRYYSIIVMNNSDSIIQLKKILAVTTIKNTEIRFLYELFTTSEDSLTKSFIENSIEFIKTIRISE